MNNKNPHPEAQSCDGVVPFPVGPPRRDRFVPAGGRWSSPFSGDLAAIEVGRTIYCPVPHPRPLALTLFADRVAAGFPNPAEDFIEGRLDLNQHLIPHPAATFFVRVSGDSMLGAGIHPGDLLVVDRSLEAAHGRVIIAIVDNELTVKRLYRRNGSIRLLAENDRYPPIEIAGGVTLEVWGVVTHVIHDL